MVTGQSTEMQQIWHKYEWISGTADAAYMTLRDSIVTGVLSGSERLIEESIASELGISRTPVREAILRLEAEQLAFRVPRKGVVVRAVSGREINEFFEIRIALDSLAAQLAAQHSKPSEHAELRAINQRFVEAIESGADAATQDKITAEFHDELYSMSGNEMLRELARYIGQRTRRFGGCTFDVPGWSQQAVEDHEFIMDAIEEGASDRAAQQARRHKRNVWDIRLRMLSDAGATQT